MAPSFGADLRHDWQRLDALVNPTEPSIVNVVLDGRSLEIPDVVAISRFGSLFINDSPEI